MFLNIINYHVIVIGMFSDVVEMLTFRFREYICEKIDSLSFEFEREVCERYLKIDY